MDVDSRNAFPRTKIGRDHQVRDQFRNGIVIDRKFDKDRGPLLRVQYMDRQGLISYWLPVKQFGSRKTAHVYTPKIGDHVNVNMLANGSEDGFVDGSFFNKKNPPPQGLDIDTRHFATEDGSIIEYREKDGTFNLDASGSTSGSTPLRTADGSPALKAGGGGIVQVTAGLITLTAPTIIINGFIEHNGAMVTTGVHTDANGIHTGGRTREDQLQAEVDQLKATTAGLNAEVDGLKARLWNLEAKVRGGGE